MRIILMLLLPVLTWMGSLGAALLDVYVTNNNGTVGSPGTFVSIVDLMSNNVEGYVDCTGFDLTHPIGIHLNSDSSLAYVNCDTVNSVFVINTVLNTVVGKVDDTLNPFNAPVVIEVNLNSTPNIAYVTNEAGSTGDRGSISIINLLANVVTGKVDDTLGPVDLPIGIGISDDGTKMYVANFNGGNVSVVDTATNTVTGYVNDVVHPFVVPFMVGWSGSTKAYISDINNGLEGFINVVVGNAVIGTVSTIGFPSFAEPANILEGPDGTMYIVDTGNNNVYEVDPTMDKVTRIFTGTFSAPVGLSITTDNTTAYVANSMNNTVSIVDLATRMQTGIVDATSFPFFEPFQTQILTPPAPPLPLPISTPLRPICIQGEQTTNRFSGQSELYNTIHWCASPSMSVTEYHLYRNGVLITSINANDTLTFKEHNVTGTIVYSVTAVDASGVESPAVSVSLP
jgi:YVTN family beta-propeller protein